jgi:hypothetical protein
VCGATVVVCQAQAVPPHGRHEQSHVGVAWSQGPYLVGQVFGVGMAQTTEAMVALGSTHLTCCQLADVHMPHRPQVSLPERQ